MASSHCGLDRSGVVGICATTGGNTPREDSNRPLTIGLAAYGGTRDVTEDARSLEESFTRMLNQPVVARVFTNESDVADDLAMGRIDAAWLPPLAFCQAHGHGDVTPLGKLVRHGQAFYRSVLFTRADNPAQSLPALKGFGSRGSPTSPPRATCSRAPS